MSIKAWVLLPPGYSSESSHIWPTVYVLGTYGSHHRDRNDIGLIALLARLGDEGSLPPFIWVFPDYAWATAPDSTDFHDFVGANLYAQNVNLYHDESNNLRPIVRQHGSASATLKDWVHIEDVLGVDGGVFRSYDWIFSPKGRDGRPQFMFDHKTGEVNSTVVADWGDHFDASRFIASLSPEKKDQLQGKLHVYVGTEDTHYLDGSVRLLKAAMDKAGLDGQVVLVPGRNHNDLYMKGDDPLGLLKVFAAQMTQLAQQERSQAR